jgi:adenylate kinase
MEKLPISTDHLDKIKKWLGAGAINIFGLPFAGKDTHGHELAELFGAPLLSSGKVFRDSRDSLSPEVREILDTGGLPPSDVFLSLFAPYFKREEFADRPLILSSVGRMRPEEQTIIEAAGESEHPIKAVVYLHLKESTVYERQAKSQESGGRGNRPEDAVDILATRIEAFKAETIPVIDIYRDMGLLIEVDSDASKEEVLKSILARLFMTASMES